MEMGPDLPEPFRAALEPVQLDKFSRTVYDDPQLNTAQAQNGKSTTQGGVQRVGLGVSRHLRGVGMGPGAPARMAS